MPGTISSFFTFYSPTFCALTFDPALPLWCDP